VGIEYPGPVQWVEVTNPDGVAESGILPLLGRSLQFHRPTKTSTNDENQQAIVSQGDGIVDIVLPSTTEVVSRNIETGSYWNLRDPLSVTDYTEDEEEDEGFLLLDADPGAHPPNPAEPGWFLTKRVILTIDDEDGYVGPLVLEFNREINPDTLTVNVVPSEGISPPPWAGSETMNFTYGTGPIPPEEHVLFPFSFTVVGNTVEITNSHDNKWGNSSISEFWIQLTSGLEDVDGNPLANPGDSIYYTFEYDEG
jgi:hypothetical protein